MTAIPGPLPRQTPEEYAAVLAYAAEIAAAAPPPTPELIAKLRPILTAGHGDTHQGAA
jgi:hypothetical protein